MHCTTMKNTRNSVYANLSALQVTDQVPLSSHFLQNHGLSCYYNIVHQRLTYFRQHVMDPSWGSPLGLQPERGLLARF
jgi:hypothetical protein